VEASGLVATANGVTLHFLHKNFRLAGKKSLCIVSKHTTEGAIIFCYPVIRVVRVLTLVSLVLLPATRSQSQTEAPAPAVSPTGQPDTTGVAFTGVEAAAGASDGVPAWYEMFTRVPGDWARFGSENFRWSRIPALVGLAGVTAALISADQQMWRSTEDLCNRTQTSRDVTHSFAELGNGRTVLAVAGAFALAGWTLDDARAVRTASQIVESYLACGIAVQVLKHLTGRERPERQSRPRGTWRFFPNQTEYHRSIPRFDAFPSGHTAGAMGMVTVLIENYPEIHWLRPVGYAAVGLVTASLVSRGWHWYSDFPLAIVLGYQFGRIAAHPETDDEIATEEGARRSRPTLSLSPSLGESGAGVLVVLTF
jgi:hypothetical protein